MPPLRQLYPEGHGVLYADVEGATAQALWHKLDAAAATTGYHPVLMGDDSEDLLYGRLAWAIEDCSGLQHCSHVMTDPQTILKAADSVNVKALLAMGGNPSYPDWKPTRGKWPHNVSPRKELVVVRDLLNKTVHERVRIVLVPTDAAWKTIAWMPSLVQAGEATPSLAQVAAVSRYWEHKYGIRLAAVSPATIEWVATRTAMSKDDAMTAAKEHSSFTPDGGSEVLEERAAQFQAGSNWFAWWD